MVRVWKITHRYKEGSPAYNRSGPILVIYTVADTVDLAKLKLELIQKASVVDVERLSIEALPEGIELP